MHASIWDLATRPCPLPASSSLLCLNDSWCLLLIDTSLYHLTFPSALQDLHHSSLFLSATCNTSTALLLSTSGDVWGFSIDPSHSFLLLSEVNSRKVVKLAGLSNIINISIGATHAAAIDTLGSLYTWGRGKAGQLGDGIIVKYEALMVTSASIFNCEQVLCGDNYSLIRTSAGFLYVFGELGCSDKCVKKVNQKIKFFDIKELSGSFVTTVCMGKKFVAALVDEAVFVFDACRNPVKLSISQGEITAITTSENAVVAMEKGWVYVWKETAGGLGECSLQNWKAKVYMIEQGFGQGYLVSGLQNFIGIVSSGKKRIGKLTKVNCGPEEVDVTGSEEEIIAVMKYACECIVKICCKDVRKFFEKLKKGSLLKFGQEHQRKVHEVNIINDAFIRIARPVYSPLISALKIQYSSKTNAKVSDLIYSLQKFHLRSAFNVFNMKLKTKTHIKQSFHRSGMLVLSSISKSLLHSIVSSAFISLLLVPKSGSRLKSLPKVNIPPNPRLIILLLAKQEKINCITLLKSLQKFKALVLSNRSTESKKSLDNKTSINTKKASYRLQINGLSELDNKSEFSTKPEKSIAAELSPVSMYCKTSGKDFWKQKPRTSSKPLGLERSKNETKSRPLKKGQQFAEEIKSRQLKNRFLKITSVRNDVNSPDLNSPISPARNFPQGVLKLVLALKKKLHCVLNKAFTVLNTYRPASYDLHETLPVRPDMWKLKVYGIGFNKLTSMRKKRIKRCIWPMLLT